jgi:hypothetical protein
MSIGWTLPHSDAALNCDLLLRRQPTKLDRSLHCERAHKHGRPRVSTDVAQPNRNILRTPAPGGVWNERAKPGDRKQLRRDEIGPHAGLQRTRAIDSERAKNARWF